MTFDGLILGREVGFGGALNDRYRMALCTKTKPLGETAMDRTGFAVVDTLGMERNGDNKLRLTCRDHKRIVFFSMDGPDAELECRVRNRNTPPARIVGGGLFTNPEA